MCAGLKGDRGMVNYKSILKIYLNICWVAYGTLGASVPDWTALYRKQISPTRSYQCRLKKQLAFRKHDVMPFTQLIFSWNVLRPNRGYFSFWASVRDAKTKKWYAWHKMADWGVDRQRSYLNKSKNGTGYYYVRLEAPKKRKADAFRIKVKPHRGVDLGLIRGLYVSLSDLKNFKSEKKDKSLAGLRSVYIKDVPRYSQWMIEHERARYMCSPTSCSMLVSYLCKNKIDPHTFALNAHDKGLDAFGSWSFNTAYAFQACDGDVQFRVERLRSFVVLHRLLCKGMPVVVSVRGTLPGGFKEYDNGHLLLVVGFDATRKQVLCHDPAFPDKEDVFIRYNLRDFLAAWERSRRLAYVAEVVPGERSF